ncbi:MAG: 50S ribosomal protein L30 [Bellilinea sp.]
MAKKAVTPKMLRITLVKSAIGYSVQHKATVRALGLRRLNQSVVHEDTPVLRGMLRKVNHLVLIEEQGA